MGCRQVKERRKVQTASALTPFEDIYLVVDELAAFASEDKRVADLGPIFRQKTNYFSGISSIKSEVETPKV